MRFWSVIRGNDIMPSTQNQRTTQAPEGEERTLIGNHYCQRFANAWEAARYTAEQLPDLEARTRQFLGAMKESSLPPPVLDAAMSNLSTLKTNTCMRTSDGRFHAFEGCFDQIGCCFGSCTHVWNYETALASLFPTFSRSLRELHFGRSVDDCGLQDFRYYLPYGKRRHGMGAVDGQMGSIVKLYLDWKLSGDTQWLNSLWPVAKRALEFAWVENGWDANRDGVMEGSQHNTYDVDFLGPNPLTGLWYLAALRAGEEMARALGYPQAAAEYRRIFEKGSDWIDDHLFNGEFYVQKVQPRPADQFADGTFTSLGTTKPETPDHQMEDGCLADQVLGQHFAHIAGLGDLVKKESIKSALQSVYKYNFKRELSNLLSVQRTYALNDEKGVVICDYSRTSRPEIPFFYYSEVWSGIEYQVAAHMFREGLIEPGLEIVEAVRLRHDGERRNPWDEPECGHHYARALASWSCVLALCGFDYSAVDRMVRLRPAVKANPFRGFWSVPTDWGSFSLSTVQGTVVVSIEAREGEMTCHEVDLRWTEQALPTVEVKVGSRQIEADVGRHEKTSVRVKLKSAAAIGLAQALTVRLAAG